MPPERPPPSYVSEQQRVLRAFAAGVAGAGDGVAPPVGDLFAEAPRAPQLHTLTRDRPSLRYAGRYHDVGGTAHALTRNHAVRVHRLWPASRQPRRPPTRPTAASVFAEHETSSVRARLPPAASSPNGSLTQPCRCSLASSRSPRRTRIFSPTLRRRLDRAPPRVGSHWPRHRRLRRLWSQCRGQRPPPWRRGRHP